MKTLREMIESGERGGFAKALLAFYDKLNLHSLVQVYSVADENNRETLQKVFPPVARYHEHWFDATTLQQRDLTREFEGDWYIVSKVDILREFPGLRKLDQKAEPQSLHRIPMR